MANQFNTSAILAGVSDATAVFDAAVPLLRTARRDYEGEFDQKVYKPGDSIKYRLDNRYTVQDGDVVTAEDVIDREREVTLKPFMNTAIELRRGDTNRHLDDIIKQFVAPAGGTLGQTFNSRLNADVLGKVSFHVGTKGSLIDSYADLQAAATLMQSYGMPSFKRWYANMNPLNAAALRNSLNNQFNVSINDPILKKNILGELAGFNIMQDRTVVEHVSTLGADGTATVNGDVADGATTVVLAGISSDGTMTKGTILEFTGYRYMDPVDHTALPTVYKFSRAVAADATVTGGAATVTLSEPIWFTTALQNVNSQILNTTAVTFIDNYTANICYVEGALQVMMPDPGSFANDADSKAHFDPKVSPTRMTLSLESQVLNNLISYRLDNLHAYDWQPELAVLLIS